MLRPQTLGDGTRWPHKCQTSGPRLYGEPEGNWSAGANFSLSSAREENIKTQAQGFLEKRGESPADCTRTPGASSLESPWRWQQALSDCFPFNWKVHFRCEVRGKGFPGGASGKESTCLTQEV